MKKRTITLATIIMLGGITFTSCSNVKNQPSKKLQKQMQLTQKEKTPHAMEVKSAELKKENSSTRKKTQSIQQEQVAPRTQSARLEVDGNYSTIPNKVFGKTIKTGMTEAEVVKQLGVPDVKGEVLINDAIGAYTQAWTYKNLGMMIEFEGLEAEGKKEVAYMAIENDSPLKTTKGIGIGSSAKEVRKTYKSIIDDSMSNDETITVEYGQYNYLFIFLKEGKVYKIAIGPMGV